MGTYGLGEVCDRCGKIYSLLQEVDQKVRFQIKAVYSTEWVSEERDGLRLEDLHLCPKCQEELATFLGGKA